MARTITVPDINWTASGYKTYLIAGAGVLFAGLSYYYGAMPLPEAVSFALGSSGLGTLRAGLKSHAADITTALEAVGAQAQRSASIGLQAQTIAQAAQSSAQAADTKISTFLGPTAIVPGDSK